MPYLEFKGKSAVEAYHNVLPHHTFEFSRESSVLASGQTPSLNDNLIIEGDNLLALKSLLPTHTGRVKCVYIDPPYNTGNEGWVYNDNLTQPQFKEWIGKVVGKEGEDACRHDKWCCMMYPRLMLLKDLLRDDGIIFVSIDDNEVAHLKILMDEIFGEENFIAELVWEKTRKNDAKFISVGHEYMLVFAKSLGLLRQMKTVWREAKPGAKEIVDEYRSLRAIHGSNNIPIQEKLRAWYVTLPKGHPSKGLSRYKWIDDNGPWRDDNISWPGGGGPRYDVIHPVTKQPCQVPERGWIFSTLEAMQKRISLDLIEFRADHTEPPYRKSHIVPVVEELLEDETLEQQDDEDLDEDDTAAVAMQVMPSVIYKQSQVSVKYLRKLMGSRVFSNPKDHEVIGRILRLCTSGTDIILDSFAGSGTTGQAVLELNKEDGNNRRFILVQQKYDNKDDEKKNVNICQTITAERVQRVVEGKGTPATGGGFSYARISDRPLLGDYRDMGESQPDYAEIAKYVFYTETSREWDPAQADANTGKIGEFSGKSFYLLYSSQKDEGHLDIKFLNDVASADPNPSLVIYCEKLWIHAPTLREWQTSAGKSIRYMMIPFNLK